MKRKQIKQPVPQNAVFRCRCGGWVIANRTASSMRGHRADSCNSCNRVQ